MQVSSVDPCAESYLTAPGRQRALAERAQRLATGDMMSTEISASIEFRQCLKLLHEWEQDIRSLELMESRLESAEQRLIQVEKLLRRSNESHGRRNTSTPKPDPVGRQPH
jgi:hypothetical protein